MKPTATTEFIPTGKVKPISEIENIESLVERYRTRVFRFIFASIRDLDTAETLTQDCFWKAHQHRSSFRGDCSVHTWLLRIAINLVRDHVRTKRFQFWKKAELVPSHELVNWPDCGISPEEQSDISDQVNTIWKASGSLSERQRTVFILRYIEDLEIHEIAESTGLSESSVNVHLVRAVRNIRRRLGATK